MSQKGTNSKTLTFYHPETDEQVDIYVKYSWYYDPGRMYMPNGDPGYPAESEIDIKESYPNDDPNGKIPDWITDEMIENELFDEGDVFEDEYEYDPEDYKD